MFIFVTYMHTFVTNVYTFVTNVYTFVTTKVIVICFLIFQIDCADSQLYTHTVDVLVTHYISFMCIQTLLLCFSLGFTLFND